MTDQTKPLVPFQKVIGQFTYATSPDFLPKQDRLLPAFQGRLLELVKRKEIALPHLAVRSRAKEPEYTLVIDVRTEPLLFNVDAEDVTFLLNESDDFDLAARYFGALLRALDDELGRRDFTRFQVRTQQIISLKSGTNRELMDKILPGIMKGSGRFANAPKRPKQESYEAKRVDAKWTVLVGDRLEYIFDLEAPTNDDWTTLWFTFVVRSPQDMLADAIYSDNLLGTLRLVLEGQDFIRDLCEGMAVAKGVAKGAGQGQ